MTTRRFAAPLGALLVLLIAARPAAAQDDDQVFAVVDYVKTVDATAFEESQRFIWKPMYQLLVEDGAIENWALYEVAFGEKADYDYVSVRLVRGFDRAMQGLPDLEPLLERAHPAMMLVDLDVTRASREILRTEVWVQDDVASIPADSFRAVEVDFMHVTPGRGAEYVDLERTVWRPVHEYAKEQGLVAGWGVYQLVFPGGADQPFNFATVSMRNAWHWSPIYRQAASVVHDTMDWDEIVERTRDLRVMKRSEVWRLLDATSAPSE